MWCLSQPHRITELLNGLGWKGPYRSSSSTPLPWGGTPSTGPRVLKAPFSLALDTSREGASTASLSNLFQCLITLIVKKFFLISKLNPNSISGWDLRLHQIPNLFPQEGSTSEGHSTCSLCVPFNVSMLSEGRLHWLAVQLLEHGDTAHLELWRSRMSCLHFVHKWCIPIWILKNNSNDSSIQQFLYWVQSVRLSG